MSGCGCPVFSIVSGASPAGSSFGNYCRKIHALLCRDDAKGRDWYDFLWYTARGTCVDFEFLSAALNPSGPWAGSHLAVDQNWCINALQARIDSLDWKAVRRDVLRFIKPNEVASLEVWSRKFFLDRLQRYAEKQ